MAVRSYVILDAAGRELVWPFDLHGLPLMAFSRDQGSLDGFLAALVDLSGVEGIAVVCGPSALADLMGELKEGLQESFADVMKKTLVLAIQEADTGHSPLPALKRLHGFRSLTLSEWSERHIEDFIGNIFQPPAARLISGADGGEGLATQLANYYQLLGLRPDARQEELGAAMRSYREYWSERAGEESSRAMAHYSLILIGQAESMLLDPIRRDRYDAMLGNARSGVPPENEGARAAPDAIEIEIEAFSQPELRVEALIDHDASVDYEELILREAMADPELAWLPGLGSRREGADGETWPPVDWPPKDWAASSAEREDMAQPLDDDISATLADRPHEPEDAADEPAESDTQELQLDLSVVVEIPCPDPGVAVWVVPDLEESLSVSEGHLFGHKLGVDGKEIWIVTGAAPVAAKTPRRGRLGVFLKGPGIGPDLGAALATARSKLGTIRDGELALAVDTAAHTGRFFVASRKPKISSLPVGLGDWRVQEAPQVPKRKGGFRWTRLACVAVAAMGSYVAFPHALALGARLFSAPVLTRLPVAASVQPGGVACSWPAGYDHVAVYRINAQDQMAHWRLIASVPGNLRSVLDPVPLDRPGVYRYLVVATEGDSSRTAVSDVQSLVVGASQSASQP